MVLSKEYPDNKNYIIYSDGRSNIIAALKGRRPYTYGFCWKYVEK